MSRSEPAGGRASWRAWWKAARPLAHANIAPPLLLGSALAWSQQAPLHREALIGAFAFGVLAHLFIVFSNDYFDRDLDSSHEATGPFSGGSRVIPDGLISPRALRRASVATAIVLVAASAALGLALGRPLFGLFALATLAIALAYVAPPIRAVDRGFGEILQAVGVGFVLPLAGYYLQRGSLEATPWDAFAPLLLLGFAGNIITALPDTPSDRAGGKKTWPVRRGEERARRDALSLSAVALLLAASISGLEPTRMLSAFLPGGVALLLALRWVQRADSHHRADCLRFVALAGAAWPLTNIGWTLALL